MADAVADAAPDTVPDATSEAASEVEIIAADPWGEGWPAAQPVDGQLLVEGTYNGGSPLWWVLDTGAARTFIDSDVTGVTTTVVADLAIGPLEFKKKQATSVELDEAEAFIGWDLGGLAGQDIFAKRFIALDYARSKAFFFDTVPESPPLGTAQAEPMRLHYDLPSSIPVVTAVLSGQTEVTVQLIADTGSGVTIITEDAFYQLDDGTLPRLKGYVWATNYGTDLSFVTRIPEIQAGEDGGGKAAWTWAVVVPTDNHLFPLLRGNGIEAQGFLGYPFYRNFLVGVDGATQTYLWWEYENKGHLDANEWNRVGIEPTWRDGAFFVEMVYSPSDAETQAISTGDRILAVDGDPVDGMTLDDLKRRLRGVPGTTVVLSLERDGSESEAGVLIEDLLPQSVPYDCMAEPLETAIGADGSALLRGRFNGKETWFVLDTAAQVVFADLELSGGLTSYFEADLDLGPIHFPAWQVKGRDLKANEESIGLDVGCLLGQELLLMSYAAFIPAVPTAFLCEHRPPDVLSWLGKPPAQHPFVMANQFPVVEVDLGLAEPVPLLLDTGQGVTFITQDMYDQVAAPEAPKLEGWKYETKYGSDEAFVSRIPELTIGGHLVEQLDVMVIPTEHHMAGTLSLSGVFVKGFMGNSVLGRFAYGLDGLTSMMDLWPLDSPALPENLWVRVGIEVVWDGSEYVVKFLLSPSDAELKGLAPATSSFRSTANPVRRWGGWPRSRLR
jgi:hypothetical protein